MWGWWFPKIPWMMVPARCWVRLLNHRFYSYFRGKENQIPPFPTKLPNYSLSSILLYYQTQPKEQHDLFHYYIQKIFPHYKTVNLRLKFQQKQASSTAPSAKRYSSHLVRLWSPLFWTTLHFICRYQPLQWLPIDKDKQNLFEFRVLSSS